jgi:hypothetical protein
MQTPVIAIEPIAWDVARLSHNSAWIQAGVANKAFDLPAI